MRRTRALGVNRSSGSRALRNDGRKHAAVQARIVSVLEEVPVQRPDRVAAGECRIGSIGVGAGLLGVQGDHRFEVRVDALDASEVSIYNLSGRALSVSNRASEGGCRLGRQRARLAVHSEGDVGEEKIRRPG